ncbi:predicted protein [Arabidopsis lyrata subsp. lyrata]|uniref:Predicted protein n=1 Tax=Arabidopsis lyrata subsp. lyrata TaxID=81972 RepID=D7LP77_ARALL|nr:predicted protein [Arabidopsis lyrata subsp. lyrata]
MAAVQAFTPLADIKPFKTHWKIQVKIVHSWTQYTQFTEETVEMVLADTSGTLIHATVKKPQVSKLQRFIVSGEWRIIEHFTLTKSTGKYRATKHGLKMSMMEKTVISRTPAVSDDIYVDLASFPDILNEAGLSENILIGERAVSNSFDMSLLEINPNYPVVLEFVANCLKCSKTAYKIPKVENEIVKKRKKEMFWCPTCKEDTPKVIPRYLLNVGVMDSTGDTKCLIFDKSAQEIIGVSAEDLLEGKWDEVNKFVVNRMKRRKNETVKENNNVLQTPNPKRSRPQQNDENINPNLQNQQDRSDVQVKGIFNRLRSGIGNIPAQMCDSEALQTVTGPSSSATIQKETQVTFNTSVRSAKKTARTQRRPFQDVQNSINTSQLHSEVHQTPLNPHKPPEKKGKKWSPPSVNSKQATKGIILTNSRNTLRFPKSLAKEKKTSHKSIDTTIEEDSDEILNSKEETFINMRDLEETREQVYECSSPDENDSETSEDYENIDDIPIEVKQRYEFLSMLDESLTKAFGERKTPTVSSRKNKNTGTTSLV